MEPKKLKNSVHQTSFLILFVELSPGSIRTIAIRCMSRQQRCWAEGLADRVGSGDATALVAELMAAV